ncbi:hypothetical protein HDV63DRAFT_60502 [Trichoderma sp. SZMC 28014]
MVLGIKSSLHGESWRKLLLPSSFVTLFFFFISLFFFFLYHHHLPFSPLQNRLSVLFFFSLSLSSLKGLWEIFISQEAISRSRSQFFYYIYGT